MATTAEKNSSLYERLSAPFPAGEVYWRVGATNNKDNPTRGIALAYIDARAVMRRLDEVLGPENWVNEYKFLTGGTVCRLSLNIGGEWLTKEDGSPETDMEAFKGGISKALVRAGVPWGIGRYLYYLDSEWVPVEKRGRSTYLKQTPKLPEWALPGGSGLPADKDIKPAGSATIAPGPDAKSAKVEGVIFPDEWEQKIAEVAKTLIASGKLDDTGYQKARVKYKDDPATMHAKMTELAA